ncbi:MAG: glycoside hydrolase family 13 protein [Lachnospiraceae bacterium]
MNKSAILHIPMSQYAYGIDETHVVIRIRVGRDDIKKCILHFGDRACRLTPVVFTNQEMHVVAQSELFDYFETELVNPYKRLNYYFELSDGKETILYYGDCFCKDTVVDRSEYYQLPFNHRADIVKPPEWVKDAVIYNIFPDSFATGKHYISKTATEAQFAGLTTRGKLGGTIRGITENVDYIKNLGVNAIYINPIFAAGEYHKYDLIDYYHTDPCFGTNEEFKELVRIFHEEGIRVIIDGVFNHCGWRFFAFEDVVQNGEKSRYKDWFYGLRFPVIRPDDCETYPNYECFGYERMMPKLNMENPETADYFCEVGRFWVREFDIDGWRLDVASEVNDGFWRRFHQAVKEEKSDAVLIGEVWESAGHWLDGTIFDSAMNYDFRKHCKRFFAEETIDAREFDGRVTDMQMRYRKQTVFAQLNVLDTHDVSRFLSVCNENLANYKLAVVFQMTFPGMPSIFYGDEKGISGIMEEEYRSPMEWEESHVLYDFFRKLIMLRRQEEVLRYGDYKTVSAKKGSRLYVYERRMSDTAVRIFINMGEKELDISELSVGFIPVFSEGLAEGNLFAKGFAIMKHNG